MWQEWFPTRLWFLIQLITQDIEEKFSFSVFNSLEDISNLSCSIVFLSFFLLFTSEWFLISPWYSLELCIQMGISFFFSFAFLFSAICKASSDKHFTFCISFFGGMVLIIASCTMLQISSYSSSGSLSDLIPWIYLSFSLYNHKGFDLGCTWMA